MDFCVRQYYNASQIAITAIDKVLTVGQPMTGENLRDAILQIRKFEGLVSQEFKTNTATVPVDINIIHDGRDATIEKTTSD
jgi:hypothetical protein